ncbi:MAG TPA: hypothetical protein PKE57_09965, partial [Cellvibrionaceae bacterium]|nr:hypothetical protein [Cellvibrionaceae bacterium]
KLRPTAINDYYEIWFNPGDESGRCPWDENKLAQNYGGNCETVDTWGPNQSYEGAHTELNELFSADVAPNAEGFRSVWLPGNNLMHIGAQLLNDAAKTVRFYQLDAPNGPLLLATGSWSNSKLPYLSSDDGAIILPLPQAALDTGHFEKGVHNLLMVKQAGYIRHGSVTLAGGAFQDSFNVLNGPAHSQVAEALKPSNASACSSTTDSIAHLTPDRTVRSIALAADGTAYLGGDFTRFAAATGSGVVLNATTGAPRNFPKVDGHVFAVVSDGAGGWYIGGNFGAVGCEPRSNLAHITQDGTLSPWQPTTNGAVRSLVAFENSIAIGGEFNQVNGQSSPYFALLDTSGTAQAITMHPDAPVYALARQENGNLVLGGEFTHIGTQTRPHLASISLMFISGRVFNLAELTDWSPQTNKAVNALAVAGDSVFVGGTFTEVNGEPVTAFAEITTEGLIGPLTSALSFGGIDAPFAGLFNTSG